MVDSGDTTAHSATSSQPLIFLSYARVLAGRAQERVATLWSLTEAQPLRRWRHFGSINALEFGHAGEHLAVASEDFLVSVWNAATGHETVRIEPSGVPRGLAFAPDDRLLAVWTDKDLGVHVWSAGEAVAQVARHTTRALTREERDHFLGPAR